MTPLEEQVEKAIEAAELALDAQMDVFLNHDNPFGFETFSPYKAAKIAIEAALAALTQPQSEEPGPYAKAFRERVCPVPEFPGIKNRQEDQA